MLHILEHKNCIGCGECCGVSEYSAKECDAIINYVKNNNFEKLDYVKEVLNQKKDIVTCRFLDNNNNKCSVYKARPFVCRIFGVDALLQCPNGNTENIYYGNLFKDEIKAHRSMFLVDKLIKEILEMEKN